MYKPERGRTIPIRWPVTVSVRANNKPVQVQNGTLTEIGPHHALLELPAALDVGARVSLEARVRGPDGVWTVIRLRGSVLAAHGSSPCQVSVRLRGAGRLKRQRTGDAEEAAKFLADDGPLG